MTDNEQANRAARLAEATRYKLEAMPRETERERMNREAQECMAAGAGVTMWRCHVGGCDARGGGGFAGHAFHMGTAHAAQPPFAQAQESMGEALPRLSQQPQPRTFTREEVLTVLKAQYAALHPATLGRPAVAEWLATLIGIFERME